MLQLIDADDRIVVKDSDLPGITDGDPDTTYTLRPISVDDYRTMRKAHTRKVVNKRTHQNDEEIDYEALNDAAFAFALVGWSGILFRGEPVPCIDDRKKLLDGARRKAIVDLAGMNQIARAPEVRAESFREPEVVPALLGR